jgi:hypothetical protein
MEKVYVYKDSYGDYRVHPGVIVVKANENLRVINATAVKITVKVPTGASKPNDPVELEISPEDHDDVKARSQGNGKTKAYGYKVTTSTGKKAHGNSDPILIIEN